MGRSIAGNMIPLYHEAISVCQNGSYHDQIIKRARVPPYMHRKSNHVYTIWQHLVLLTLRQYKCKSYRRFEQFLQEAFGVVEHLGLSTIPHYTTLQKAAARLKHGMLLKMLESFVLYVGVRKMFVGIDSTGLPHGQAHITTQNASNYEENLSRCQSVQTWYRRSYVV